jgi:ribosomal protein L11 methyltransferase
MVLRVVVPTEEVDAASDTLWTAGASAVAESPMADGAVELTADLDVCPPALVPFAHDVFDDDGSWRDGWRPFARAVEVGPFVLHPPWVDPATTGFGEPDTRFRPPGSPKPRLRPLVVDAGHAFGTGSHPSTTLALSAIADLIDAGRCRSVLDVGCGSGVLAIGAALLGAAPVVAIDIDPAAIDATTANAVANDVTISVTSTPLDRVEGRFDLVAANLGSPLVVDLAAPLAAHATDIVVLSGLLEDRWAHVPSAYPDFAVAATPETDGWRAVVLRRR